MLTIKKLKEMKAGTIFAKGEVVDSPEGANMANTGKMMKWVVVRGDIHDWAIYSDNPYMPQPSFEAVRDWGDKITGEQNIKRLVPCDDESFNQYRY